MLSKFEDADVEEVLKNSTDIIRPMEEETEEEFAKKEHREVVLEVCRENVEVIVEE